MKLIHFCKTYHLYTNLRNNAPLIGQTSESETCCLIENQIHGKKVYQQTLSMTFSFNEMN